MIASSAGANAVEGYYVRTVDDLFLAVKGLVHPPDRVIGVVRYAPDPAGDRQRRLPGAEPDAARGRAAARSAAYPVGDPGGPAAGTTYRRVYRFDEQEALLAGHDPAYVAYDPVFGERLQGAPRERIADIFDPRAGLGRLRRQARLDPAERDSLTFAEVVKEESGVAWEALGVSGSLLIGLHTRASDIDVVVYGEHACRAVQTAVRRLLAAPHAGPVEPLTEQGLAALYAARVKDTWMSFDDFARHERRKVIQGTCHGREYFIRFVQDPSEGGEAYGDWTYRPVGHAAIRAVVVDDRQALFTPCIYGIANVQILDGPQAPDLNEIVSFRGRFCEQAWADETVVAAGKLEKVYNRSGQVHHRLLLGGRPEDTMATEVAR